MSLIDSVRPHAVVPLTGLVVFEQFETGATLASEPRGESYVGHPLEGGPDVVLRYMSHPVFASAARATWGAIGDRFERLCVIEHANVERVITGGVVRARREDLLCVVTERIGGHTLQAYLRANGALAPAQALAVARRIAHGLMAAHQAGVVHGDLRASNVLLTRAPDEADGSAPWPVLTDVGLNNLLAAALGGELSMRELAWAPESAAPEQIRGEPATVGTDVYALGLLLYRMLTGATPFASENASEMLIAQLSRPPMPLRDRVAAKVPASVESLVMRSLAKAQQERFASIAAVLDELEACEAELRTGVAAPRRPRTPQEALRADTGEVVSARVSSMRLIGEGRARRSATPLEAPRKERLQTLQGPKFHGTGEEVAGAAQAAPPATATGPLPAAPAMPQDATAPFPAMRDEHDQVARAMRPLAAAVVGLTLVCGLLGGYVLATFQRPAGSAAAVVAAPTRTSAAALVARPAPRTVRVRVRTSTPDAQVMLRGRAYSAPMVAEIATGTAPEMIEVVAPGYEPRRMWMPLTEHVDAQIDLVPVAPAAPVAALVDGGVSVHPSRRRGHRSHRSRHSAR